MSPRVGGGAATPFPVGPRAGLPSCDERRSWPRTSLQCQSVDWSLTSLSLQNPAGTHRGQPGPRGSIEGALFQGPWGDGWMGLEGHLEDPAEAG